MLHPKLVLTEKDGRALSPGGDGNVDVNDLIRRFVGDDPNSGEKSNTFAETFMANLTGDDIAECPICFSEPEAPAFIPGCMHQLYVSLSSSTPCSLMDVVC